MSDAPDRSGFADAQSRLRAALGRDVTFFGEVLMDFPDGTPINPQTGRPYDPVLAPSASACASGMVRCNVQRVFGPRVKQLDHSAVGVGGVSHVMLIADDSPANRTVIEPSVRFVLDREDFKVLSTKRDAPIRGAPRLLVFGRTTSP